MNKNFYELVWDIVAVAGGLFLGWKVFIYFGDLIPAFGYILGVMLGLITFKIVANIVHALEIGISYTLWKITGIQVYKDPSLHFGIRKF